MRSLILSIIFTFIHISTSSPAPQIRSPVSSSGPARCKAIPDSPDWPSDADWANLNAAVSGRLLRPNPPAAACHRGWSGYNAAQCALVNEGWRDSDWHANNPTSNMWQNYNNYSCVPDGSAPCTTAGYPLYVVAAREAKDVKAAVDFARTRNVRLNIKSTGHDFLGRSVQPNSLSIWTHALKGMKWYDSSFTPKGCRFAINGPAVTVGSGSQWGEIFSAAGARGVGMVGGNFRSVSVGGYLSNGGHGLLSAKYGLGADMVLEIELVTAGGEIITANECQNQDYFWAMRGGGGSTYGVALSYTLQGVRSGPTALYLSNVNGWGEIAYIHSQWPKIAAAGGSGYIRGYPGRGGSVSVEVHLPNATSAVLRSIVNPIMAGVHRRSESSDSACSEAAEYIDNTTSLHGCKPRISGKYYDFSTWEEARRHIGDSAELEIAQASAASAGTFPGLGANKIIVSWLWSAKDVASPQLQTALRGAFDAQAQLLNDATMGVGTQNPPYIRGGGNAVNPAFRTAVMRPAAELQWDGTDPARLAARKRDALRFGASLRSLSPGGGTYANEADPDTPDWQHAFWGSNYERLLSIKSKVDPLGVFYCRSCVGSEYYSDIGGVLCRK